MSKNEVKGPHCKSCGQPDQPNRFNEGYSSCCNKRIVYECDPRDCSHQDRLPEWRRRGLEAASKKGYLHAAR